MKQPEKSTENMLLQFPKSDEIFLACIAVLQDFVPALRKRNVEPVLHCAVMYPWHLRFLQELLDCKIVATEFDLPEDRYKDYELVHKFDPWHALHMAHQVDKHITQALGILIGADSRAIPDVTILWADKDLLPGVLITTPELLPRLGEYCCRAEIPVRVLDESAPAEAKLYAAMCAEIVVGFRGAETYVAAASGRDVIELYPSEEYPKNWLAKWASEKYRMIYGPREKLTSELAFKSLEVAVRRKANEERMLKWRLTYRPNLEKPSTLMAQ